MTRRIAWIGQRLLEEGRLAADGDRIARDAARMVSLLLTHSRPTGPVSPTSKSRNCVSPTRGVLRARARASFEERRLREHLFGDSLFGEPGWDILLSLYIAEGDGEELTTGRLFAKTKMPASTALRWLNCLREMGLIAWTLLPRERAGDIVGLSDEGRGLLDKYFARLT